MGTRPGLGGGASSFRRPGTGPYRSRGMGRPGLTARPAFYNRTAPTPWNRGANGLYRGRGRGYRYGYGYPGFFSAGLFYNPFFFDPLFGFGDPFFDYGDPYGDFADVSGPGGYGYGYQNGYQNDNYAAQQETDTPAGSQANAGQSGDGYVPGPATGPGPWAPQRYGQPDLPTRQEALVTIVFRDGRPPEQIRNYALTRSALLLTGPQMREIPLDEIDLPATQRVNHTAGVDFRLPQVQ